MWKVIKLCCCGTSGCCGDNSSCYSKIEDGGRRKRSDGKVKGRKKILKGVNSENFDEMVERSALRYEISDHLKNQILEAKGSETEQVIVRDENYLATVVKTAVNKETHLDVYLQPVQEITGLSGQCHEKVLKGIMKSNFDEVVERLAVRYELSDTLKNKILKVKESDTPNDKEVRLEGENYSVVVVKRENVFDLWFYSAVVTFCN